MPPRPRSRNHHQQQQEHAAPSPALRQRPTLATDFKFPSILSPVEGSGDSPVDAHAQSLPLLSRDAVDRANANASASGNVTATATATATSAIGAPPRTPQSTDENPPYAPSLPSIASPAAGSARAPHHHNHQHSRQRSRAPSLLDSNASVASRFTPLSRIFSSNAPSPTATAAHTPTGTGAGAGVGAGPGVDPGHHRTDSARSSADLYSVSNLSSETLESEYTQYTTRKNHDQQDHRSRPPPLPLPPSSQSQVHSHSLSRALPQHGRGRSVSTFSSWGGAPRGETHAGPGGAGFTAWPVDARIDKPELLLIGYAQVSGAFSVDGSLVDQAQFEQVKRSGVVGTIDVSASRPGSQGLPQHGGKQQARSPRGAGGAGGGGNAGGSGFWSSLGLVSKLEESLSGLLGNGELDGLREMRGVVSSSSIPLLSTPQSLLFVDLQLRPGEEKSYRFKFALPEGLPASHRGKAIRITYNLIIGVQRPSGGKDVQKMSRISVPFRVLSGVDDRGRIPSHDLMRPHVLLGDEASVQATDQDKPPPSRPPPTSIGGRMWSDVSDFMSYINDILQRAPGAVGPSGDSALASPAVQPPSPTIASQQRLTCQEAIDSAILRSNRTPGSSSPDSPSSPQQQHHSLERRRPARASPNRFEITRGGRRIAVIIINRPAHRLGETVVVTVDFAGAALPCYSLYAALETSEHVDSALALRSGTSIARATRRTFAACAQSALFARRLAFTPTIPVNATPTLVTSGVQLVWALRFEFVTSASQDEDGVGPTGAGLLEVVEKSDRHAVMASLESMACDAFEVSIPLTVYGSSTSEPTGEEVQGYRI
ncbi:hypothetical protein KEM52_005255 [Ascosphaera acerosa]|nr:hypothetical protein KEM52_005255 [Ascosphaera acerosa]